MLFVSTGPFNVIQLMAEATRLAFCRTANVLESGVEDHVSLATPVAEGILVPWPA